MPIKLNRLRWLPRICISPPMFRFFSYPLPLRFCRGHITVIALLCLIGPFLIQANGASRQSGDQAEEYIQARKIAMKDPHVQAAFEKAYERLDQRIVEIDPSLKTYVEKRSTVNSTANETSNSKHSSKPASKQKKVAGGGNSRTDSKTSHVVAAGETLSSIAVQYNVSVSALKSANNITDDRKLRIGQKLVIPSPKHQETGAKKEKSFWEKVTSDF